MVGRIEDVAQVFGTRVVGGDDVRAWMVQ